jgi:pantothenate kinase
VPTLVARARSIRDLAGSRVVLGITGPPGAGKSTVTGRLLAALGADAVLVPMDGFHFSNRVLRDKHALDRKGAPDTFDTAGYLALLDRIRTCADDVIYAPSFRREIEEPIANDIAVPADVAIVLTEGNYLLTQSHGWSGVRERLDEVWFVEVDSELRLQRLTARHAAFGKDPEAAMRWASGPDEANARLVNETRDLADAVILLGD